MTQEQIKKIVVQLADHESRLHQLEGRVQTCPISSTGTSSKQKTLREIIKGRKFKSGQEQIAVIVGYYEKILGQRIAKEKIKEEWTNTKMPGKFAAMFFSRAKDTLIRIHPDNTCDLTDSGEKLFDQILKDESSSSTSQ